MGSHLSTNPIGRLQLARYETHNGARMHFITEHGKKYLQDHGDDYAFIISSGFSEAERKEAIDRDFRDLIVEEGFAMAVPAKQKRKRSRKLTELARQHFTKNDMIRCSGCQFSFNEFYGETARNYIEIHHLKPIYTYTEEDIVKSLSQALTNLAPLCANCHRMMHREASNVLGLDELRGLISAHGIFAAN